MQGLRSTYKGVFSTIQGMATERDSIKDMQHLAERSLRQTDEALVHRRELTARFVTEINREIAEAKRMLNFLGDPWKHGDHTEYEFMRISLDNALATRKKDRRAELLREWKDLLRLRERRMELLRESVAFGSIGSRIQEEGVRRRNNR